MNLPANAISEETGQLRRYLWLLGLILAVAVLLRSYHLSSESLWFDEAFTVHAASGTLRETVSADPNSPPLYYVLLHFWMQVFGTSESAARSLSVVSSTLAVLLTALLGARLYDRKTGLLAAAFMAVSSFQICFAQEARQYALFLALQLASLVIMEAVLRPERTGRAPWLRLTYLATLAALYTHFYGVFFVAAQNLFFLLRWREHRRRLVPWLAAQAAVVLLFLPWLVRMLVAASGGGQVRRYLLLKLPQAFFSFLVGETVVPLDEAAVRDIAGTLLAYWPELALSIAAFGGLFVAALAAARRRPRATCFVAAMGLAPVVIAFAVSFKLMLFDERYLIGVTPALYLFLASGVVSAFGAASRWQRPARIALALAAAAAVGITFLGLCNYYFHPRFGKEQWREAVRHVEQNARPGDLVVFHPGHMSYPFNYYATRTDLVTLKLRDEASNKQSPEWAEARALIEKHSRVWLVRSHFHSDAMVQRFRKMLPRESHVHFPKAKGIDIYLMEK